ncbi:MAG: DUF5681 domain-containing protein [Parvibaculaceae bacterium]
MTKRPADKGATYEVGFGRPPKEHQFKKGRSGNPRGRPKKSKVGPATLRGALIEIVQEKVSYLDNGVKRRASQLDLILRKLTRDAMKGDRSAMKAVINLLSSSDLSPPSEYDAPDTSTAWLMAKIDEMAGRSEEARAKRQAEEARLSHPGSNPAK